MMPRIRNIRALPAALSLCTAALVAQNYPPPFPRKDAVELLDNDRVEVWDVLWPKGQPTAMHEHPYDQISITLVAGSIKVTRPGGTPSMGKSEFGSVTFVRKGTIHAEEGTSDVPQHKIMVELKPSNSPAVNIRDGLPGAFPRDGGAKVLETDGAIAWDLTWKPGQKVPRHADYRDSVTVFLEGGTIRSVADGGGTSDAVRKAGDVVYSPYTVDAHTEEAVRGSPRAIVVELK
jgi:quercetin dioxygenase-like cupin family protein